MIVSTLGHIAQRAAEGGALGLPCAGAVVVGTAASAEISSRQ
jgi:hypothetical protein